MPRSIVCVMSVDAAKRPAPGESHTGCAEGLSAGGRIRVVCHAALGLRSRTGKSVRLRRSKQQG
eukprot:13419374-Alexandrium_andersonii.AAC.1